MPNCEIAEQLGLVLYLINSQNQANKLIISCTYFFVTNYFSWFQIIVVTQYHIDYLVQERCNSIANALELHLSYTTPLICGFVMSVYWDVSVICLWSYTALLSDSCSHARSPWPYWTPLSLDQHDSITITNCQQYSSTLWGCHFADDIFRCIFVNEKFCILSEISLKFVPMGLNSNKSALVQAMAWCQQGDKPLSEPLMVRLLRHVCLN